MILIYGPISMDITLDFSRPSKPTNNAFIESFNGRFRAEWLNAHWFLGLEDAREKLEAWRRDYNELRPHSAIGNKPRSRCTTAPAPPARQERYGSKTLRPDGLKLGSTSAGHKHRVRARTTRMLVWLIANLVDIVLNNRSHTRTPRPRSRADGGIH